MGAQLDEAPVKWEAEVQAMELKLFVNKVKTAIYITDQVEERS